MFGDAAGSIGVRILTGDSNATALAATAIRGADSAAKFCFTGNQIDGRGFVVVRLLTNARRCAVVSCRLSDDANAAIHPKKEPVHAVDVRKLRKGEIVRAEGWGKNCILRTCWVAGGAFDCKQLRQCYGAVSFATIVNALNEPH